MIDTIQLPSDICINLYQTEHLGVVYEICIRPNTETELSWACCCYERNIIADANGNFPYPCREDRDKFCFAVMYLCRTFDEDARVPPTQNSSHVNTLGSVFRTLRTPGYLFVKCQS